MTHLATAATIDAQPTPVALCTAQQLFPPFQLPFLLVLLLLPQRSRSLPKNASTPAIHH
jgi:hypothetical protein